MGLICIFATLIVAIGCNQISGIKEFEFGDAGTDTDTDTDSVVIGEKWVTIPAGSFWMGSPDVGCPAGYPGGSGTDCVSELGRNTLAGHEELHEVTLTRPFEMMRYEVTQEEFEAKMGWNPSTKNCRYGCGATNPVYSANWYDAVAYANKLSTDAMLTPCYNITDVTCEVGESPTDTSDYMACYDRSEATSGGISKATVDLNVVATPYECTGYRLPTEAEWEYAIRAGSWTAFYPSDGNDGSITYTNCKLDENLDQIGWYCGNAGSTTHPVGGKKSNLWGLNDMSGNVSEWVWDWYAVFTGDSAEDPTGPSSAINRVLRGGHRTGLTGHCRSAYRVYWGAKGRFDNFGFRLSRSVPHTDTDTDTDTDTGDGGVGDE